MYNKETARLIRLQNFVNVGLKQKAKSPDFIIFQYGTGTLCAPGSSVGIATGYGLDGPGIETRWRQDFPHQSRPALGPPSLLCNRYRAFPGYRKRLGRDADPSPPFSAEV
jgi:hypothetical protein